MTKEDVGSDLQYFVNNKSPSIPEPAATDEIEELSAEEDDPDISKHKLNPTTDHGEIAISTYKRKLIQAHSILMLIAWPMVTFTGIFFAAWMKPALPNGEWFKVGSGGYGIGGWMRIFGRS